MKLLAAVLFSFIFIFGILLPAVSAHRVYIIKVEEGRLQVLYEGGIPAGRAVVTLFDRQGNKVDEGSVDPDGFFYFDPSLDVGHAAANDGLGHLARFEFKAEEQQPRLGEPPAETDLPQPQIPPDVTEAPQPPVQPVEIAESRLQVPLVWRVLLGLLFLAIIGIIFHRRKSK